jgi:folate-binding protein YgfZ
LRRADRGLIVVSGQDRATYLQGLLTNDIVALAAGMGCYAAYLTPQGRMIADVWVYEIGDVILVSLSRDVKQTVLERLDQFIFSEDVQLGDLTEAYAALVVAGPDADKVVASVIGGTHAADLEALPEHGNLRTSFDGSPVIVLRVTDLGVPALELVVETPHASALATAISGAGAETLDESAAEALRIEAGIPRFHHDMNEETIPLEAGIESRAISLTKGCYVGQEVIIRVLHRGHGRVARKLSGLVVDGEAALRPGTAVYHDGREIGRITSSTVSPTLGHPIALAYLHRDSAHAGSRVSVDGATATVTVLPFVR